MGYGYDREAVDAFEVRGIAGVNGEVVRYCDGGNHGVITSGCNLAATAAKRGSDLAESSRHLGIEGQRVEIRLYLLKMCLSRCTVLVVGRREWSY
jgi:hypothetical protein